MPEIEEVNKLVTLGLVDERLLILQVNVNVKGILRKIFKIVSKVISMETSRAA